MALMLQIYSDKMLPGADNTMNVGSLALQFKDLYVNGLAYIDGLGENCLMSTAYQLQFRDAALFINSIDDGHLDLTADISIDLNANVAVSGNLGVGVTSAAAAVHIKPGTAAASTAPLKLSSGASMSVAETGAVEYDGTNLFFTRTSTTRESVLTGKTGAGVSTSSGMSIVDRYGGDSKVCGDPNAWVTVTVDGVSYKIPLYV